MKPDGYKVVHWPGIPKGFQQKMSVTMQPAMMAPPNVLSQNLQAITQIINIQQQMMDQQQDWL